MQHLWRDKLQQNVARILGFPLEDGKHAIAIEVSWHTELKRRLIFEACKCVSTRVLCQRARQSEKFASSKQAALEYNGPDGTGEVCRRQLIHGTSHFSRDFPAK